MNKNNSNINRSNDRNSQAWRMKFKDVKNIAKNIGTMTLGEIAPSVTETVTSSSDALRETRQFISKARNQIGYQANSLNGNTAGRRAKSILKEALEDLKNGSYGLDKMSDESYDMADDFDADIRDADSQITSSTDPNNVAMFETRKNTALLGKAISRGNATMVEGLGRMSKTLAGATLKASQAQTTQLTNVMLTSMNSQNNYMGMMNNKLDAINTNLINIIDYNNNAQTEFYQKTAEYQSSMLEMMSSLGESIAKIQDVNEMKAMKEDEFDFSRGFNLNTYKNMVKKNIDGSMLGMIGSIGSMAGMMGNPITMMLPMLFGSLVPGFIKKPVERFDKSFTKGMEGLLYRLGDKRYEAGIMGTIGEIFGKERPSIAKLNMGNYKKDAMAWNGKAQKYLTEVIPSYLAKIESGINGTPERYFHEGKGHFMDNRALKKDFQKTMSNAYEFSMQDVGEELNRVLRKSNIKGNDAELIRQRINDAARTAVHSSSSSRGKNQIRAGNMLRASLHGKVDENSIADLVQLLNSGINEAVQNISHVVDNMETSYRQLYNQDERKINLGNQYHGDFTRGRRYTASGMLLSDIDDEGERIRAERELSRNEGKGKKKVIAKALEIRYGKNWHHNKTAKAIYEKLAKKRDNKANAIDRFSNNLYYNLSGINGEIDLEEADASIAEELAKMKNEDGTQGSEGNSSNRNSSRRRYIRSGNRQEQRSNVSINQSNQLTSGGSNWDAQAQTVLTKVIPAKLDKIEKAILKLEKSGIATSDNRATGQSSNTHPTNTGNKFNLLSFKDALGMSSDSLQERARRTQSNLNGKSKGNEAGPTSGIQSSADIIADRLVQNENSLSDLVRATNDNFMAPMVGGIFGKDGMIRRFFSKDNLRSIRDKLFDEKDGIFKGVGSWFRDQMDYVKYVFTGKGYTNRKGEKFEENKNSVFDHIANGYDWVYQKTMQHIFGEDFRENENYKKYFERFDFKSKREAKRNKRLALSNEGDTIQDASVSSDDVQEIDDRINELKSKINSGTLGESGLKKANKDLNILYHKRKKAVRSKNQSNVKNDIQEAGYSVGQKLRQAGDSLVNNVIGKSDDKTLKEDRKKFGTKYKDMFKKFLPVGIAGAIVGGGLGLLGSMQGTGAVAPLFFSGGPIAGAVLGVSATILARSEKFQKVLFGEKDEDGNRKNGLISQKTQNFFKKNAPMLVGGAALGALKGVFKTAVGGGVVGGPGGFLMNTLLPGGILGGAVMGLGVSLLKSSDRFTNILFGNKGENEDKKQSKSLSKKISDAFSKSGHFVKGGLKGAVIGAGSGIALNSMGIVGGALSLGGPVGMGLLGLGLGIASQTDRVKEMLFGTEEFDEDGNSKGRRKNGLFPRMRNYLVMNVFEPLKNNLQEKTEDFAFWIKKKITYPFRLAFGPIIDSFREIRKNISDTVKNVFENVGLSIVKAVKGTVDVAFKPVTKAFKKVGTTMTNVAFTGAKMALMPATLPINLVKFGSRRLRKRAMGERTKTLWQHAGDIYRGVRDVTKDQWENDDREYIGGPLGKIDRFLTHGRDIFRNTRQGIDAAKASYNEGMTHQGFNSLGWMNVKDEMKHDKKLKKQLKGDRKQWKGIDEVRKQIALENGHSEIFATDEQLREYKKKLKKGGLGDLTNFIQTSGDLNDLLYNKEDFLERIKNGDRNVAKNPTETSKFFQKTRDYQEFVMNRFDVITKAFMKYATQNAIKRRKNLSIQNLSDIDKNLKQSGLSWEDIGIEPGSLADVTTMSDEDWGTYMRQVQDPNNTDPTKFNTLILEILDRQRAEAEKNGEETKELNERFDSLLDIELANAKLNASEQVGDTGASASDISRAAGHDFGTRFDDPITRHKKEQEKAARKAKEDAESEAARKGHRSFQDEDDEDKENEEEESKKEGKENKKGFLSGLWSGFKGFMGGLGGLFGNEKFWKTAGITTIAAATLGPWAHDIFKDVLKFLNPVTTFLGKKLKDGAHWLQQNMPNIVQTMTSNIVNNMGFVVDSVWEIAKSLTSTIGKKAVNSVFKFFGNEPPFPEVESQYTGRKEFATEEEAQAYAKETGRNVDGKISYADDEYIDEEGNTHRVKGGAHALKGTAIENALRFGTSRIHRKTAGIATGAAKLAFKGGKFLLKHNPVTGIPIKLGETIFKGGKNFLAKKAASGKGIGKILLKIENGLKSIGGKATKILKLKKSDVWDSICIGLIKAIEKVFAKNPELQAKLAEKVVWANAKGLSKFFLPVGIALSAYDAVYGAIDAAYLFGVAPEDVNGKMRSISALINFISGLPIASWFDLIAEVIHAAGGGNFKQMLARGIYHLIPGDDQILDDAIDRFELEYENYKATTKTNLKSVDEYNELVNDRNMFGFRKNKVDRDANIPTDKELEEYQRNKYNTKNYTSKSNYEMKSDNTVFYQGVGNTNVAIEDPSNVGFGIGDRRSRAIGYGLSQSDPRWANYTLGKFPSGRTSTMATGGCGPTALSMVANNTSPLAVAKDAKNGGYIKDGGATADLFTKGAKKYGLNASKVSRNNLEDTLKSGKPTIISGKSSGNGPYTENGHVIVANGMDNRGNAIVNDPMRGTRKIKASELSKGMTHGWSYSNSGSYYGAGENDVVGYGGTNLMLMSNVTRQSTKNSAINATKIDPSKNFFKYNGKKYKKVRDALGNEAWQEMGFFESTKTYKEVTIPPMFDPDTALAKGGDSENLINVNGRTYNATRINKQLENGDKYTTAKYNSSEMSDVRKALEKAKEYDSKKSTKSSTSKDSSNSKVWSIQEYGQFQLDQLKQSGTLTPTMEKVLSNKYGVASSTSDDKGLEKGMGPNASMAAANKGTLKTAERIKSKINSGFQTTDGEYNFNRADFYRGLKVADLEAMAAYNSALLNDSKIPKFKAVYKYYVKSGRYEGNRYLQDKEIESIFGRSDFVKSLGGIGTEGNYNYKYGFPFFQTDDSRWGGIDWRGTTVKGRGGDLASLAMVATAYGPNILDPEYIYENWLKKNDDWYDNSNGLHFDKVFSEDGYPAQKGGYVNGAPVKAKKLISTNTILSYLKANKPVVMTGYRYRGGPFGGYYDRSSAPTSGPDDYATIVARAANDSHMAVLNPFTTLQQNGIFDIHALNDIIGKGNTKAIKEAYGITGPSGGGITGKVDLSQKGNQTTDYIDISEEKGLGKVTALFKNIVSIVSNLFDAVLGNKEYVSIFEEKEGEGGSDEQDNGNGDGANLDGFNSANKSPDIDKSYASANLDKIDYDSLPYGSSTYSLQNSKYSMYNPFASLANRQNAYLFRGQYYLQSGNGSYTRISDEHFARLRSQDLVTLVNIIPKDLMNGTAKIYSTEIKTSYGGSMGGSYVYTSKGSNGIPSQSYILPKWNSGTTVTGMTSKFTNPSTQRIVNTPTSKDRSITNRISNWWNTLTSKPSAANDRYSVTKTGLSYGGGDRDLVFYGPGDEVVGYGDPRKPTDPDYKDYINLAKKVRDKGGYSALSSNEKSRWSIYKRKIAQLEGEASKAKAQTDFAKSIRQNDLNNILNKIAKGQTLTNAEQKTYDAYINRIKSNDPKSSLSSSESESDIVDGSAAFAGGVQYNIPEIQKYMGATQFTSGREKPKYLAMHYTCSVSSEPGTAKGICDYWNTGIKASADYVVDDGQIWQYNPDPNKNFCWAVGDDKGSPGSGTSLGATATDAENPNTISIEMQSTNSTGTMVDDPRSETWSISDAVVNNSAGLAAKLMNDYNIPDDNLIMHHHVSGKICPGPWARSEADLQKYYDFKKKVLAIKAGGGVGTTSDSDNTTTTTEERDFSKLPASVRMGAIINAGISAAMGDNYEEAKQHYLEQAYDQYFGGPTTTTSTTPDTSESSSSTKTSSGNVSLDPGNVPQSIWNYFTSKGYSTYGTAGIMGNMNHESGMIVNRKQGDFSNGYTASAQYTKAADEGSIDFVHDSIGYGLVQFTYYTLKQALLDRAKREGKSVGDLGVQLDEIDSYLNGNGLAGRLKSASSVREASNIFLHEYERPADQSAAVEQTRASAGEAFFNQFSKGSVGNGLGDVGQLYQSYLSKNTFTKNRAVGYGPSWLQVVADIKKLMADLKLGYSAASSPITYNGETQNIRRDCSGYVSGCLHFYGIKGMLNLSTHGYYPGSCPLDGTEFTYMPFPGVDKLIAGDILIDQASHVEIYAGNGQVYNCGSTPSVNNPGTERMWKTDYPGIWRPTDPGAPATGTSGKKSSNKSTNTSSSIDSSSTTGSINTYMDPFSRMVGGLGNIVLQTIDGKPIAFGPGENSPQNFFENTLGGRITSNYGNRSSKLGNEFHRGVDIQAPKGRKIYSPVSGKIVSKGNDVAGYGNYAVVRDVEGKNHLFAHMDNESYYGVGDNVNQFDIIGEVGSSGRSTGSHLHYEIRNNGNKYSTIDPTTYSYDSDVSKSLNIHNANRSNYASDSADAVGSGNRDITPTNIADKLEAASNTEVIADKMDAIIDALKIMVTNTSRPIQQPATSTITQNNTTVYGTGDRKKTQSKTVERKQSTKTTKEDEILAGIHKTIAKRD